MDDSQPESAADPAGGLPAVGGPPGAAAGMPDWPSPGSFERGGRGSRLLGGGRSATVISTASTLVVLGALAAVFLLAPGARAVEHAFFSPAHMWQSFIGNPKQGYYSVGAAILLNIKMFVVAEILILILALVLALIRQSSHPALLLSYSAYVSEVYRAGLISVHQSQVAAARSLGLPHRTALRYVILPQAVRNIIPPLLNDFISLQKDTALVGVLGTIEANKAADIYSEQVFNFSSFTVAAILFLILTIPLARFTDRLIERDRRRRLAGAIA